MTAIGVGLVAIEGTRDNPDWGSPLAWVAYLMFAIAAVIFAILILALVRRRRKPPSPSPPLGRIGYVGRPGSQGNLPDAQFGKDLDRAIDNQGKVDAERARFGVDFEKDEDKDE